jgi:hypothetical protein
MGCRPVCLMGQWPASWQRTLLTVRFLNCRLSIEMIELINKMKSCKWHLYLIWCTSACWLPVAFDCTWHFTIAYRPTLSNNIIMAPKFLQLKQHAVCLLYVTIGWVWLACGKFYCIVQNALYNYTLTWRLYICNFYCKVLHAFQFHAYEGEAGPGNRLGPRSKPLAASQTGLTISCC